MKCNIEGESLRPGKMVFIYDPNNDLIGRSKIYFTQLDEFKKALCKNHYKGIKGETY
jgi:hypothetical protein